MPTAIPADKAWELKLIFLRELEATHQKARQHFDELLVRPDSRSALMGIRDFFHKIAGTSYAADLALLGHLAAVCEQACELIPQGASAAPVLPLVRDGMAGVASVLESFKTVPTPPTAMLSEQGLVQPGIGEERVLSKILVVDDDPFSANLIDTCLRSAGFMSSYCTDANKALDAIAAELPDLIVLDVVMPGIDGFDLCRRVRAHPAMQLTPIIFVTRKGDVDQRVAGLEAGGNDYIAKPFEPQELVARVRSHLQRLSALRDMAIRDGLTRCYNHKYFKVRLNQEIARCRRYKCGLALGLLDVDHFKAINDTHGHQVGDVVLAQLGNLVQATVRATDVVARYGGDEFGMLFVEAGAKEANAITVRLLERIAAHRTPVDESGAPSIPVTVSVGVTHLVADDTMETLIRRTDAALYEAKANGRNQVKICL
ncbi:MAG TPA: diguanylate cyclase [Myxococcales bacterium]|jgi:diguanylate cyclase (GGDEF)-like protein